MTDIDINITCCMCDATFEASIELPFGWTHRYGGIDDDLGFCKEHADIAEWADSQCPGCVGAWADCSLWNAFAYRSMDLSGADLETIKRGICPKRTGGIFTISSAGVKLMDLKEVASAKSGVAFAEAILEYSKRYHKNV